MDNPATEPKPSRYRLKVFFRRLFSSMVLWSVVLTAMFSGNKPFSNYVFLLIMVVLAAMGLIEFYDMALKRDLVCFRNWGVFGGVMLMAGTFLHFSGKLGKWDTPARVNDFETSFLIVFVLGLCVRQFVSHSNTAGIEAISVTLFGLMYVPWLLNFIQKIHFFPFPPGHPQSGAYYVLYFILVTKFSDTGAYACGSLFGKHKMIPRISPGKTWEGFAGGVLVSTGASVIFARLAGPKLVGMTPMHSIILGVLLSIAAVIGDLIESLFKREAGVKDSGTHFPGIGGILDLLDSLLFNAPLMYVYLRHVLTNPAVL